MRINSKSRVKVQSDPLISVVIATRNEVNHIASILKSLLDQTYKNIEIIVVDNSTDSKTIEIASQFGEAVYDLSKSINEDKYIKNFRGAQVNFGVNKSHGEIIFFPDADMTFDTGLLQEIAERSSDFDALYIPEIMIGKGFFGKVRNFERSFYHGTLVDAVRVVNKDLYVEVGGYDVNNIVFGADDWDLTKTIKLHTKKISTTTSQLYHHEELMNWKTFLAKKKKYVHTFDSYINKWGKRDEDVKRQLGTYYRAVTIFTENGKWTMLFLHPVLAICMYFTRFVTWIFYKIY